MTLALGILFWLLIIVAFVLWLIERPQTPPFWSSWLLFVLIIILGVAVFGPLHFVR